nr:MAG TPA: hypothetical protein [Caudoviricetes sp.]
MVSIKKEFPLYAGLFIQHRLARLTTERRVRRMNRLTQYIISKIGKFKHSR